MKQKGNTLKLLVSVFLIAFAFTLVKTSSKVQAAPQTFVVNSVNDETDANTTDGICETTTPGECTLRAAILQANSNNNPADTDVINFNISGSGVHTITINSEFSVGEPVTINGYSQPGAVANSAVWPAALNGTLQIEIAANYNTANPGFFFDPTADNSTLQGLIINNMPRQSIYTFAGCDNLHVYGNYINTDPSGLITKWHTDGSVAIEMYGSGEVGGSDPAKRNVISSNKAAIGVRNGNVDIKGNNFFVGSDSVTPLPPNPDLSLLAGYTAIALTGSDNIFGGPNNGEGNTVENYTGWYAVSVGNASSTVVAGNHITDNTSGIATFGTVSNITIGGVTAGSGNIISGGHTNSNSSGDGIVIQDGADDVTILGNYIGVAEDGVTPFGNEGQGIVSYAAHAYIGGAQITERNVISANGLGGIQIIQGSAQIVNNYIGVGTDGTTAIGNQESGVLVHSGASQSIIGGTATGEQNIIANNGVSGIVVSNPKTSILQNKIYDNDELGIDLQGSGVTLNDELDTDAGANDLLNFPRLKETSEAGGDTAITYRLDVPAGDYRIEYYANTTSDPSGYGEGETFVGSQNITSSGSGLQEFTMTVPSTGLTNLSGTATVIDGASATGFGPTSEFGDAQPPQKDVGVSNTVVDQNTLATNGTIQYDVTYTNNGIDPIDLTQFDADSSDPLNRALYNDIFPSNLSFASVTGDADCSTQNNASLFTPAFSDHSSATVLSCGYSSNSPQLLEPGQHLSFRLTFNSTDPSATVFSNYILAVPDATDADYPDYQAAITSGNDIITELGSSINNLSTATTTLPYTNLGVEQTIVDADSLLNSSSIQYKVTITNYGDDPVDISQFDGSGGNTFNTSLFNDIAPAELTYTGVTGDVLCSAPASASGYGSLLSTHTSYNVISCKYNGASPRALSKDDSIEFTLSFDRSNTNPGNYVFTNYVLSAPLESDYDNNNYSAAVNSGNDIIDELGTSINNLNEVSTTKPNSDISITHSLTDPQDVAQGATLNYQLHYQNNGPAPLDLSEYNTPFATNPLIYDIIHPDLTPVLGSEVDPINFPGAYFVNSGNNDLTCIWAGPASYGPYFGASAHGDYGVIVCWYTDTTNTSLASGAGLDLSFDFTVSNTSKLGFVNYAYAQPPSGSTHDPDESNIGDAINDNNDNIVDATRAAGDYINNFADAPPSADIGVTANLVNPQDFAAGNTVSYDVTITNRGIAGLDLANTVGNNPLFSQLFPSSSLTLLNTPTTDMQCFDVGPGSYMSVGALAQDHPDYQIAPCFYSGADGHVIAPGQSYTVRVNYQVKPGFTSSVKVAAASGASFGDPDVAAFGSVIGGTQDQLETLQNDNYALVSYTVPGSPDGSNGSDSGTNSSGSSSNDPLSNTGENILKVVAASVIIIAIIGTYVVTRHKRKSYHSRR